MSPASYASSPFSLRNKLARTAWQVVYVLLFRPSPRILYAWRSFLLRCFGAQLGPRCHIYPKAIIWAPWQLVCSAEVGVADGATLYNQAVITLGRRVVVSQGAHLCTGTHDYESFDFSLVARPITVGDYAWLAAECFVHPGILIEQGAVIGARAVVTKDMPAWTVCAGHPCRPLKSRQLRL